MKNDNNEQMWSSSGSRFQFEDDDGGNGKYNFSGISKFSTRTAKPVPSAVGNPSTKVQAQSLSYTIVADNDIMLPELQCDACQKLISDSDDIKYEGNKVFTNQECWKHWIALMVDKNDFRVEQLCSMSAKRFFLDRVCKNFNGELIIKAIVALKGVTEEMQFFSLMEGNQIAYNHYLAFMKETNYCGLPAIKWKSESDRMIKVLEDLFRENAEVTVDTVNIFKDQLMNTRDNLSKCRIMPQEVDVLDEYIALLELQAQKYPDFLNQSLIETLTSTCHSILSVKDVPDKVLKEKFKLLPEEHFWTTVQPLVQYKRIADIDIYLNQKSFGSKPAINYENIVSFLVSLNGEGIVSEKELLDMQLWCLTKISSVSEMVACAKLYRLFEQLCQYSEDKKDKTLQKKLATYKQSSGR